MSDQSCTRQKLYERIRQLSREEFILQEMIPYGFWSAQGAVLEQAADEIRRRGEIQRELAGKSKYHELLLNTLIKR